MKNSVAIRIRDRLGLVCRPVVSVGRWLLGPTHVTVPTDAISFQSDVDEIVEELPPRLMRSSLYIVAAMILSMVVVASVNKVEVVVVGTGTLVPDSPPIVLQPIERAIIRELRVKTGAEVSKGQVLAVMDSTVTKADINSLLVQQKSLQDQIQGLDAELATLSPDVNSVPDLNAASVTPLYIQRRAQYKSRLRVLDEDILRLQAGIHSTEDDRVSLSKQLVISREAEQMRAALTQSQAGSKLQYMDAQSFRMRSERELQTAINRLIELHHDLQAKLAERQFFIDEWRRQALETLTNSRTELIKINDQLTKANLMNDFVVITAPENGVVLSMAKLSVGSVLGGGEHLMTIMPTKTNLVGEIMISSRDIGYVKTGDETLVKIDAFPYQRHGLLHGRLMWISEQSFGADAGSTVMEGGLPMAGRSGGAFHRGWIQFDSIKLENMPTGARPIPGMTLSADIKVGSRSIISYLLYPIARAFTESIREP